MFKNKNKDVCILDFGRGSIKGIVFTPDKKNIIRKLETAKIERYGVFDGKDFELDVIKKSAKKVFDGLGDIKGMEKKISFSPDILKAQVFNVSFKRNNPEIAVTDKEKESIHKAVLKDIEQELGDIKIIKKEIIETKVAGYSVDTIQGFKGEKLEFRILILFFKQEYVGFEQTLKLEFDLKDAGILHFVEGLNKYLSFKDSNSGIFVNIGIKSTIIVIFKNGLSSIDEFSIGGADFCRKISDALGMKNNDAESFLQRFAANELSQESKDKVIEITASVMEMWLDKFRKKMENRTGSYEIPSAMYIFGNRSECVLIKKAIQKIEDKEMQALLPESLPIKTKVKLCNEDIPSLLLTLAYEK